MENTGTDYGTTAATSPAKKKFIESVASKAYKGPSVVDYLNASGADSSLGSRNELAAQYGVKNYNPGTAESNTALMSALRGGGTQTNETVATPPAAPSTPAVPEPKKSASSSYYDYLKSLFDPQQLKTANENVTELNKRSSDEIARARFEEEKLRKNEIGQLSAGQTYGLNEAARLSNKSLADIAIAKGASTDVVNQLIAAGKDLTSIDTKAREQTAPFELSPGQERYTFNESTGKYEKSASAAPALKTVSGGTTVYDPVTGEALYTAPKTYAPKTASSTAQTKNMIAQGEQKLNAARGADGFTDPYLYKDAYDEWVANKMGTAAQFLTKFPPKNYVNPKASSIPGFPTYLQNKTKSSSRAI